LLAHFVSTMASSATMEAKMMNQGFSLFAEALVFVHGSKAESEAALHAALCERSGDSDTAARWRELQRRVRDLRTKLAA
jgi:hypothetical protein